MKVGQLLSMDAGDLLPAELTEILAWLRAEAKPMPMNQLMQVLESNWGKGWNSRFQQFSFQPLAAASIGQVHKAQTKDGQPLALKIQYPGVRQSIDSDVDNVAALLRISGLLPKSLDIQPLLQEAKRQLHQEADYVLEAQWLQRYHTLLQHSLEFTLPHVYPDLTTPTILAMSYVGGKPIEHLIHAPQPERDRVATLLIKLFFRELFEFKLVQTDPNFANYHYDSRTQQLILLDFGATRAYDTAMAQNYRDLMQGAVQADTPLMENAATRIGYFQTYIQPQQRKAVTALFVQACEPLCHNGNYDFGHSTLAMRLRKAGMALSFEQDYWHTPPADAIFLHRKLAGLYLLAARLKARVNVHELFQAYPPS